MSSELADKAARARIRQCFDLELTHLRAGSWQGLENSDVTLVGYVSQLHGTVCTCCRGSVNYGKEVRPDGVV